MSTVFDKLQKVKKFLTPSNTIEDFLFPIDVKKYLSPPGNENIGNTLIEERTTPSLLQRTGERLVHEELQKQTNLEQILEKTESLIINDVKNSTDESQSLDKDWLMYYSENACKVSDEQMQNFWAKLLSGEIVNPGTFSKRTIDALLKLSSNEANLFEKICGYVLETRGGNFLINDQYFENISDLSYSNIMRLDECGLLVASGMNRMKLQADKNQAIPIISNNMFIKGSVSEKISVEWQAFPLTTTGIELMKITFNETPKYYLKTLIEYLKKKYPSINWSVHKITDRDKEDFYYDEEDITTSIKTSNFETP